MEYKKGHEERVSKYTVVADSPEVILAKNQGQITSDVSLSMTSPKPDLDCIYCKIQIYILKYSKMHLHCTLLKIRQHVVSVVCYFANEG